MNNFVNSVNLYNKNMPITFCGKVNIDSNFKTKLRRNNIEIKPLDGFDIEIAQKPKTTGYDIKIFHEGEEKPITQWSFFSDLENPKTRKTFLSFIEDLYNIVSQQNAKNVLNDL